MALKLQQNEWGDYEMVYVPDDGTDWNPSATDIGLMADLGYNVTDATEFLKGMEEAQAAEGAGVAGSTGGSWAAPSATWWNLAKQLMPSDIQGQAKLAAGLAGAVGGALTGSATPQRVGYQGSIPQYTAVRQAVQGTYDPNRRPGSSGQQYFTDTQYIPKTDTAGIAAARTAAQDQANLMAAANAANPAKQGNHVLEKMPVVTDDTNVSTTKAAQGGLMGLARGRYLQGSDRKSTRLNSSH